MEAPIRARLFRSEVESWETAPRAAPSHRSHRGSVRGSVQFGEGEHESEKTNGKKALEKRSWAWSVAVSVAVVGVGIVISATVNPLFDRAVHWDGMAVLAPALLVGLAVALRNRWA